MLVRWGDLFEGCLLGGVGSEGWGEGDWPLMRLANEEFRLMSGDEYAVKLDVWYCAEVPVVY